MNIQHHPLTVLVGGCFDILHFGHFEFLRAAKALGDSLVVALESDASIRRTKGDSRPFHSQEQRRQSLEAIRYVDRVITLPDMTSDTDYNALVTDVKPDVIAVTEGDPIIGKKRKQAESVGARLAVIPKIPSPSTTSIAKLLEME